MKNKILSILLGLTFFPFLGWTQQKSATISFSDLTYDFGTIKEDDGVVTKIFEFANTGGTPLIIHRVITSCGCTTPDWPKQPVLPGSKSAIKVEYNPKGRTQKFNETITVYTNTETPTVILQIKGFVKEHEKTPEELYNRQYGEIMFDRNHVRLDRILMGKIAVDTLNYMNFTSEPVKLSFNQQTNSYISVKFIPETIKPNEKGIMVVSYDPSKRGEWGLIIDRFMINVNDKLIQNNFFTITGTIEEDFSKLTSKQLEKAPKIEFDQTAFDFGQITEGKNAEYEFVFRNTGKSDLIIRKIKPSCGCTTVEPSDKILKPGASSSIKASFRTDGYSGRQTKSITVITNDPKSPSMVLRLSGVVVKP